MLAAWSYVSMIDLKQSICIGLSYDYKLAPDKTLADFNMEGQGDLPTNYPALEHLHLRVAMRQQGYAGSLPRYEKVLASFLAYPYNVTILPRDYGRCLLNLKRQATRGLVWKLAATAS